MSIRKAHTVARNFRKSFQSFFLFLPKILVGSNVIAYLLMSILSHVNFDLQFRFLISPQAGDKKMAQRLKICVGSLIEWLRARHGVGSKSTRTILFCPWERHYTALSPAWLSGKVILNFNHISIKLKKFTGHIPWHLRNQVRIIDCPIYSLFDLFCESKVKI